MKLTPREPTPEMAVAGSIALRLTSFADLDATIEEVTAVWRAMHDAAPSAAVSCGDLGSRATETHRQLLVLHGLNPLLYEHAKAAADVIEELLRHLSECIVALETMGHPIEKTQAAPSAEPVCAGDPGECGFNGACMYKCGRVGPPVADEPVAYLFKNSERNGYIAIVPDAHEAVKELLEAFPVYTRPAPRATE